MSMASTARRGPLVARSSTERVNAGTRQRSFENLAELEDGPVPMKQAMVGQASVPAQLRRPGRLRHQAANFFTA